MAPSERTRLSIALFARGVVLFSCAAIAVRWPDQTLFFALVGAGAAIGTLGIFQLGMHIVSDELVSTKIFLLGDGMTTLVFGILCIGLPMLPAAAALYLAASWLVMYAAFVLLVAGRLWYLPRERLGLLSWAAINLACAVAVLLAPLTTLQNFMYAAVVYLWCSGLVHLTAALWTRRRHRSALARAGHRHAW
jgi:uncharacterized membrane protein HdeD (DUF308 family)